MNLSNLDTMSLAPLQKVLFFTRPEGRHHLLDLLQASEAVHLTPGEVFLPEDFSSWFSDGPDRSEVAEQSAKLEKRMSVLEAAIESLQKHEQRVGFAAHFMEARELATLDDFYALERYDECPITLQVEHLDEEEHQILNELRTLQALREKLTWFGNAGVDLELLRDSPRTFYRIFLTGKKPWNSIRMTLEEVLGDTHTFLILNTHKDQLTVCVIGQAVQGEGFDLWLEQQPIKRLVLPSLRGTPAKNLDDLAEREATLRAQLHTLNERRHQLTVNLPILHRVYDFWNAQLEQIRKSELLRRSPYTAVAGGWIHTDDVERLQKRLDEQAPEVVMVVSRPGPNDNPPVDYNNPPLVKPFEFVSDLYSRPKYRDIDPTPYLGGFFALFFGICLTDAGYGLVLTLATFLILKKATGLSLSARKLIRILFFSGIATTLVGTLTGGFFGLSPANLPGPLSRLGAVVVLSPMENQMGFLALTLALGLIQVTLGIFLRMRWNLTHGHKTEAWLDQAPWLAIILGIVILITANVVETPALKQVGYVALIVAALVILLFAGRASRNPIARLGSGLFSLYQISGLFGDVLSYVRLFALGLATGVIAGVVNFLAQLSFGIPYLGFVFAPLVLIFGHVFNLAINALGGFIHTTRLQFVEFFGKFYEGGGDPFEAFGFHTRYTKVIDKV